MVESTPNSEMLCNSYHWFCVCMVRKWLFFLMPFNSYKSQRDQPSLAYPPFIPVYLVSLRISSCACFERSRCASGSPYKLLPEQASSVSTVTISRKPVLRVFIVVNLFIFVVGLFSNIVCALVCKI